MARPRRRRRRDSSLALTSTMLCALFTVSVLVVGLPALVLPAC